MKSVRTARLNRVVAAGIIAVLAGGISACSSASAPDGDAASTDESFVLKVATFMPPTHITSVNGEQYWMDEIEKATDGRVTFEHYPAGQLVGAAESLSALQTGIVDVAVIVPSYYTAELPLSDFTTLPIPRGIGIAEATDVYFDMLATTLAPEWEAQGVTVIFGVLVEYQVLSNVGILAEPSDFAGYTVRSPGGAGDSIIQTVGASPVDMASDETYTAMERRTVDAAILPLSTAITYDMQDVVEAVSTNAPLGASATMTAISNETWAKLPADIQEIIQSVSKDTIKNLRTVWDESEADAPRVFSEAGAEVYELSEADLAKWDRPSEAAIAAWTDSRNARSLDADGVVAEWIERTKG